MATRNPRQGNPGQRSERDSIARDDRNARMMSDERGERGMEEEDLDRKFADGMVSVEDSGPNNFDEFMQEALPDVPKINGWHCCWLSTTANYDPIHKRKRMGYQPVTYSELPGFEVHKDSSGSGLDDVIRCNEMALYKIPMGRYLQIMKYFHHDQPRDSETAIKERVEALQREMGSDRSDNDLMETASGFKTIINRRAARFAAN